MHVGIALQTQMFTASQLAVLDTIKAHL